MACQKLVIDQSRMPVLVFPSLVTNHTIHSRSTLISPIVSLSLLIFFIPPPDHTQHMYFYLNAEVIWKYFGENGHILQTTFPNAFSPMKWAFLFKFKGRLFASVQLTNNNHWLRWWHYCDVIMGAMASQIISLTIVYSKFIQAQIKENIKAVRHWPLCWEFTGDRWIPRTNGQ